MASRFRTQGNVFERLGAISSWSAVRYWSISKQSWRPLVLTASVIGGAGLHTASIPLSSLVAGADNLFVERDENSGETTYRLRVLQRSAERIVVSSENTTPIRIAIVTAFEAGSLQTVTFVQSEGGDVWTTYQIMRAGPGSSSMALGHKGSFLNRLEAVRRYLAGQPTDQLPPLAPR